MGKLTFRIDDVSANTDLSELRKMIKYLKDSYVCEVWLCVNPFSKESICGSVYPNPPFKDNSEHGFFYRTNKWMDGRSLKLGQDKIVSHGLFHADHSVLQYDAQEMSIIGSCEILKADTFVPPFNRFNNATDCICRMNKIKLVKSYEENWKSLEHEDFNLSHTNWYFHPWRFTFEEFKNALTRKRQDVSA